MIEAHGLCRRFRSGSRTITVLDDVNLSIADGEFVAVMGPSGSGKSTLLNVLGGLDVHYEGEVTVAGVKLRGLPDRDLSRFRGRNVGFVFQSFHLVPNLPAVDNVLLPSFFNGTEPDPRARAEEVLARVGLSGKKDRVPARLSGGERQRVAIARALMNNPRILFADEPTGNLDAETGKQIMGVLERLHQEQGQTVIMVTHEPDIASHARRVVVLRDGTVASDERRDQFVARIQAGGSIHDVGAAGS